jgi:hypothetical protein
MWVAFMTAITPDGGSKRAVRFDTPRNQSGRGKSKIIERRSLFNIWGERGRHIFERIRVAEKLKLSPLPKQGGYMNKLKLMLIDWLCRDDPKKLIRIIIKRHLPDMHIAKNPQREKKEKHEKMYAL